MFSLMKRSSIAGLIALLIQTTATMASNQSDITDILAHKEAPFGVVLEIVEGSDNALE